MEILNKLFRILMVLGEIHLYNETNTGEEKEFPCHITGTLI